jgi:D-threo-aldose 1-dehydrogenase
MGAASTKERLALLEAAFDAGITHFDTAPYYGYGESERVVGEFLVGKRNRVTLTTKYGIQTTGLVKKRWVNLLARRILHVLPVLRKVLPRRGGTHSQRADFTADEARKSLEASLTALKTDYVDLFLLHEPGYQDAASEELAGFLEKEVERGTIRAFGCGGGSEEIFQAARVGLATTRFLQFEDNAITRHIEQVGSTKSKCLTYGPFNSALRHLSSWLAGDTNRCATWSRELDLDCGSPETLPRLLLASSLRRNRDGVVLFSTRSLGRIRSAVAVAEGTEFCLKQLEIFDHLCLDITAAAVSP